LRSGEAALAGHHQSPALARLRGRIGGRRHVC
jgi:hypothetical protein